MDKKPPLIFEMLNTPQTRFGSKEPIVFRVKIPGGWLIYMDNGLGHSGATFVPDPTHEWDGGSLP
jgi:hypothetical protein